MASKTEAFVYILLYAAVAWRIYDHLDQFLRQTHARRYYLLVKMLVLLYPSGCMLKLSGVSLTWLRYHLSDIGFPVALGALLAWCCIKLRKVDVDREYGRIFKIRCTSMVLGVFASVAYEFVLSPFGKPPVGRFDLVDVLMYVIGGALAITVLLRQRKAYAKCVNPISYSPSTV